MKIHRSNLIQALLLAMKTQRERNLSAGVESDTNLISGWGQIVGAIQLYEPIEFYDGTPVEREPIICKCQTWAIIGIDQIKAMLEDGRHPYCSLNGNYDPLGLSADARPMVEQIEPDAVEEWFIGLKTTGGQIVGSWHYCDKCGDGIGTYGLYMAQWKRRHFSGLCLKPDDAERLAYSNIMQVAIRDKQETEFMECLFDGGSVTVDAVTGKLVMATKDQLGNVKAGVRLVDIFPDGLHCPLTADETDKLHTALEPDEPASVSPAEPLGCPCRSWAVIGAEALAYNNGLHHPDCDGHGNRKDWKASVGMGWGKVAPDTAGKNDLIAEAGHEPVTQTPMGRDCADWITHLKTRNGLPICDKCDLVIDAGERERHFLGACPVPNDTPSLSLLVCDFAGTLVTKFESGELSPLLAAVLGARFGELFINDGYSLDGLRKQIDALVGEDEKPPLPRLQWDLDAAKLWLYPLDGVREEISAVAIATLVQLTGKGIEAYEPKPRGQWTQLPGEVKAWRFTA